MAEFRLTTKQGKSHLYEMSGAQIRALERIFEHLHRFPDHAKKATFFFEVEVPTDRGPVRAAFEPAYIDLSSYSFGNHMVDEIGLTDQAVSEEYARMFRQILADDPVSMKVVLMETSA